MKIINRLIAGLLALVPVTGEAWAVPQGVQLVPPVVRVTPTDRSGLITLGGQAQQLAPAVPLRNGLCVQNLSSGDEWFSLVGTAAVGQPSQWLPSGAEYCAPSSGVPVGPISIFGATTGQTFSAREW